MRSRESGFTLIEIMIVMAIIVTLAGMVMMIVPYATERSKRLNCANNLSQLGKILVSQATVEACGPGLCTGNEFTVTPKGMSEPITIYEVGSIITSF